MRSCSFSVCRLSGVSVVAEEVGQVIALLREQKEVLENRLLEMHEISEVISVVSSAALPTPAAPAPAPAPVLTARRRPVVPEIPTFASRVHTGRVAGGPAVPLRSSRSSVVSPRQDALRRLERQLEAASKRTEIQDREIDRLRRISNLKARADSPRINNAPCRQNHQGMPFVLRPPQNAGVAANLTTVAARIASELDKLAELGKENGNFESIRSLASQLKAVAH